MEIAPAPVRLLDKIAPLLEVKANLLEVEALYRSLRKPPDLASSSSQLLAELNLLGQSMLLTFEDHKLSKKELKHMLELGVLPAVLLMAPEEGLAPMPLLLAHRQGSKVIGTWHLSSEDQAISYTVDELISRVFIEDEQIPVFTPIVVNSRISEHTPEGVLKLNPVQRLWRLLGTERKDIIFIYIYSIAIGLLSLTTPLGIQAIIGLVSGGLILEPVIILIGFVIFGTLLSGILQILLVSIVEIIEQRLFARVAFEFAFRMPRIRMASLRTTYAPELMNRFFDVLTIQKGFAKILTDVLSSLLQIFFGLLLLAFYHPIFITFGVGLIIIVYLILRFTFQKGLETSILESKYKYKAVQWIEEVARTVSTFKLAGNTNIALNRMDKEVVGYLDKRKQHFKVLITQFSAIVGFKVLITASLLILGAVLVINREITLGQFVASEIVIITLLVSVEKLILSMDTIYDVLTAVDKISHVTDLELEENKGMVMPENIKDASSDKIKGIEVKVQGVGFSYPDKPLLKDVSLHIKPGECVGITGPAGSGKSTLLKIISGLYTDYTGSMSYDNMNQRDINIFSLRDNIGEAVSADEIIMGTVVENICMNKPNITQEQLNWAIEKCEISNWLNKQPNGLETMLMPGGENVSASLGRKIILARSIVEMPRLLVIDEFFNAMDADFIAKMIDFVTDPKHGWTLVTVTRNSDLLKRCDKVVLVQEGKIHFEGTYAEAEQNEDFTRHISPLLP